MKYTGITYRPPIEAGSLLLQVTVGCAHNKCRYCTMYKNDKFSIETIEQIESDLQEARRSHKKVTRVFLVNGDAFVLSANKLKIIATKINEYFPEVEVITMYAAIRNIMDKTDNELQELLDLRINDLWVGLETGNEEALNYMNKGFEIKDSYEQLERLNKIGMRHNGIYMLGGSGKGKSIETAIDTAKLINATKPELVAVSSLGFFGDSQLSKEVEQGTFIPATELEILQEEKKLIELIEVENIPFYGDHPINTITMRGMLPRDKEALIDGINNAIAKMDKNFLNGIAKRYSM